MGGPLRIAKVEARPVPEVVATLEKLLTAARAGSVRSLVAIYETNKPYTTASSYAFPEASMQMLLGELERSRWILVTKMMKDADINVDDGAPSA